MIQLRKGTIKELIALQQLYVETIKNTCAKDYNEDQIRVWSNAVNKTERWHEMLTTQYVLVAENDSEIVGFGTLKGGDYLDFLYVSHLYLRQGIAQKLYDQLKLESIRLGFKKLSSDVSKTARPFFEKNGFEVIHENKLIRDEVEIINYHMCEK